jgi:hypothetical protein
MGDDPQRDSKRLLAWVAPAIAQVAPPSTANVAALAAAATPTTSPAARMEGASLTRFILDVLVRV